MYQRILVPVDGSPTSLRGLQEAIRLAKDGGASLRLVHVVDEFLMDSPYAATIDYQAFLSALRANGKLLLEKMRKLAREQGIQAECELLEIIAEQVSATATETS